MAAFDRDLTDDLDYVTLFHRHLGISIKERGTTVPKINRLRSAKGFGNRQLRRVPEAIKPRNVNDVAWPFSAHTHRAS
jgi:hypothetical protein